MGRLGGGGVEGERDLAGRPLKTSGNLRIGGSVFSSSNVIRDPCPFCTPGDTLFIDRGLTSYFAVVLCYVAIV